MDTVANSGTRLERRKDETRTKITKAAMSLFDKQGFNETTMEQIAETADVAKKTLYNHFPVKEAIVSEYIQRAFSEQNPSRIQELERVPDTRSRIILVLSQSIERVQEQKELFEKYLGYRMKNMIYSRQDASTRSGFHLLIAEIIELGQKNGEIRNDLPFSLLVDQLELVWIQVVKEFYMEQGQFQSREVIEQCVDLFVSGAKSKQKQEED